MKTLGFLLILPALFPQEKNEAEELLKKSSEKLAAAQSFQCKAQLIVHGAVGDVTVEQTFQCAAGNKLRFEMKGKFKDKELKYLIVSDGSKVRLDLNAPEKHETIDTPADLNVQVLSMIPRLSLRGSVESMCWPVLGGDKPMECIRFNEFKSLKVDKASDREVRSISYLVNQTKPSRGVEGKDTPCTLWIDAKTLLPVKRELKVKLGHGDHLFMETYSEAAVDEKIDPAKFELPKDPK